MQEIGVVPDFAFGLTLADGSRRNFLVEIDRGTMPVVRSRLLQRSRRRTRAPDAADVPCRRAWTDAGGALGREALDAATVASSARTTVRQL